MKLRKKTRKALRKASQVSAAAIGLLAVEAIGQVAGNALKSGVRRWRKRSRRKKRAGRH